MRIWCEAGITSYNCATNAQKLYETEEYLSVTLQRQSPKLVMLAKIFLVGVFVPIYLCAAVFAKQRSWLGMVISGGAGMLLFMMIPMMTPLDATVMHAGMCLAGGALFCLGLGKVSALLLRKRDLV